MRNYFLELRSRTENYSDSEDRVELILNDLSSIDQNVNSIEDDEFWLLLDIFDKFSEISEFGMGEFVFELFTESDGWPYNDKLLLRPTRELSVMAVKGFALDDDAAVLETNCIPKNLRFDRNIGDYWDHINWNEITLEERKLILKTIGFRQSFSEPLPVDASSLKILLDGIPESEFWLYTFDPARDLKMF